jgi:hypothetical protein
MNSTYFYRCRAYNVEFECSLEREEIIHCPICGMTECVELNKNETMCLCSRCGDTIFQRDAKACRNCSKLLCTYCQRHYGKCLSCSNDKDMPTAAPIRSDRIM